MYFREECVVGGVGDFFGKDFLQLTFSSLRLLLTWQRCIIILTFPKKISHNLILYFHTAILLDVELKLNVYKTFNSRPVSRGIWRSLRTYAIEQILLNNNMFKVNNKYTKTRCEIKFNKKFFLLTLNEF